MASQTASSATSSSKLTAEQCNFAPDCGRDAAWRWKCNMCAPPGLVLTPHVLDQLLLHSHMLGYVAACRDTSRQIRCQSMSRAWCLLINRRATGGSRGGPGKEDLCALLGIRALCDLAPTCRSVHDATLRLALCPGCLRGQLQPRDAEKGRKSKRFRIKACGHTTCGCAWLEGCPKCSHDAFTKDMRTMGSNEDLAPCLITLHSVAM